MCKSTAKRQRTCSTEKDLTALAHGSKRICVPIGRAEYERIVMEPQAFRQWLDPLIAQYPELFPAAMAQGYQLHDILPVSQKLPDVRLRRILVADPQPPAGNAFTLAPACVLPYMTGYTDAVAHALFLRGKFGVPYWGLTHVFGHNDLYWQRLELSLRRNSIVGTTVKQAAHLPQDVLADEKHTWLNGYTGLCRHDGSRRLHPGRLGGRACRRSGPHRRLSAIQDRSPDAQSRLPADDRQYRWLASDAVGVAPAVCPWHADRLLPPCLSQDPRSLPAPARTLQRARSPGVGRLSCDHRTAVPGTLRCLKTWAAATLPGGKGLEAVLKLGARAPQCGQAYDYPTAHRTSKMLDRRMEHMDRRFYSAHYFHGHLMTAEYAVRAEALLVNFLPYCPRAAVAEHYPSPAHKLNGFVYHVIGFTTS